jgi:hypothetical protein
LEWFNDSGASDCEFTTILMVNSLNVTSAYQENLLVGLESVDK